MEDHYRRLVWAVLLIAVLVVAGVGWGSLRGAPRSTVSAAAPRRLDLPAGPADSPESAPAVVAPNGTAPTPAAAEAAAPGEPKPSSSASAGLRVHVVGSVRKAGVYALPAGARVIDAVKAAGGARPDADLEAINLADFARDGEQILVPSRRMTQAAVPRRAAPPAAGHASMPRVTPGAPGGPTRTLGRYPSAVVPAPGAPPASAADPTGVVNVNTAGLEELDTLPGVGPATAQAILDYRREHGPFQRPEDLLNVRGIGEKKLAQMLPRVRVR
jgi:competence protein ComEA